MPRRNAIKVYGNDQYYHCYNRGANRANIFREDNDYGYFLSLFKRHLSNQPTSDATRRPYPHYKDDVELIAYCLMPNHYHLVLYNKNNTTGVEKLMRSVMTAYSRYFNVRYGHSGTLFESHFLASRISSEEYLWHVSRYVHLNPLDIGQDTLNYRYSSIQYFSGQKHAEWLHPERLVEGQKERQRYLESVADLKDYHQLRDQVKYELAR